MANDRLWQLGEQYEGTPLEVDDVDPDPTVEFRRWFAAAEAAGIRNVNAMTLATIDDRQRPAARIVLLKEIDDRGYVFFTNYESHKGTQLTSRPWAALVFYWEPLHRQVRVEGAVERVSAADSDAYFAVRPRGSQLGAIASPQSQVIDSRQVLERRVADVASADASGALPRPAYWGGFRVIPDAVEFWQGQPSRLHDRICYRRSANAWVRERLAP